MQFITREDELHPLLFIINIQNFTRGTGYYACNIQMASKHIVSNSQLVFFKRGCLFVFFNTEDVLKRRLKDLLTVK